MAQIVGQEGLGELLGGNIGQGFSQGVNQLTQHHLQKMLTQKKTEAAENAKKSAPWSPLDINKEAKKLNFNSEILELNDAKSISEAANEKISMGKHRDEAIFESLQEFQQGPTKEQTPYQMLQNASQKGESSLQGHKRLFEEQMSMFSEGESPGAVIKKGISGSIPGRVSSLIEGESLTDFNARTQLKAPNWWKNALYGLSKFGAESPVFAAGGVAGSPGGPVGAGAGAMALPAMIEKGLEEYQKYLESGKEGTFGDFIDSLEEVGKAGLKGGAEGAILGSLGALKIIKNIPGLNKLLNVKGGKAAGNLLETGAKAGVFTAVESGSRGKFPTLEEYGSNLALFLGFDALGAVQNKAPKVYENLKKSGLEPEKAATRMKEIAKEKNYDLKKPNDIIKVSHELSKEAGKVAKKTKKAGQRAIKETEQPSPSKQPKELAERISNRPVDEYITKAAEAKAKREKPPTAREQAKRESAGVEATQLEPKVRKIEKELSYLKERQKENLKQEVKESVKNRIEKKQQELSSLKENVDRLRRIERSGKEPITEAKLEEQISKRLKEMVDASVEPNSQSAEKIDKFIKQNKKSLDRALSLNRQKKLPDSKTVDTFTKVHDSYIKGYERLLDQSKKLLDSPFYKGTRGESLNRLVKSLEKNIKVSKAKLKNHRDKWNTLNQLKGPKGAMVKQNLKDMRNDIQSLQKDFVKQIKAKENIEVKVEAAKDRALLEKKPNQTKIKLAAEKLPNELPKIEKKETNKIAEEAGVDKTKLEKALEETNKKLPSVFEKIRKNPNSAKREITKLYRKMPFPLQIAVGAAINQGLKSLGIPYYIRSFFVPAGIVVRGLSLGVQKVGDTLYNKWKIDSSVKKLLERRQDSFGSASNYLKELKRDLKPKEYKQVLEKYKEARGF